MVDILKYTEKKIQFEFTSGENFPDNLTDYDLVIHCGACMLNRTEMLNRINECQRRSIPVSNFGVVLSKISQVKTTDII